MTSFHDKHVKQTFAQPRWGAMFHEVTSGMLREPFYCHQSKKFQQQATEINSSIDDIIFPSLPPEISFLFD